MTAVPHILIVMDGWALSPIRKGNAVAAAKTPNFDFFWANYPHTQLEACGRAVGLPEGQMGGSEVGHLNLGAGRVMLQDMTFIESLIESGEFFENDALLSAINNAKENDSQLHFLGLLSDGGVHSDISHLFALLELAKRHGLTKVFVHAMLDGRDVSPKSASRFFTSLDEKMNELGVGKIASISGRYSGMDRDHNWDRIESYYDVMTSGLGEKTRSWTELIESSYANGVTDEFVTPTVVTNEDGTPVATISDNDSVVYFNFRSDRAKQMTRVFTQADFSGFQRKAAPKVHFVCFKRYDDDIQAETAFAKPTHSNLLAEYLSQLGLRQLHIAETEKYNHVTYFFNGERMEPFEGEDRIKEASPDVATYDLKPEMSAYEITEKLLAALDKQIYDFIVLNFANGDMVGHSGIVEATMKAVETVDECVGKIVNKVVSQGGTAFVTADHGNADEMIDLSTLFTDSHQPWTAHSLNPVPFIVVSEKLKNEGAWLLESSGKLADVAPTMLKVMGIDIPDEMTGNCLLKS